MFEFEFEYARNLGVVLDDEYLEFAVVNWRAPPA
jgi:hypothetical protein